MTESEIKSLTRVVTYYIDDEKIDYVNYSQKENAKFLHIYSDLLTLQNFLENDEQLNRCPRCGESDFEIEQTDMGKRVFCICGMLGPVKRNEEDAMHAWNNRT